MRHHYTTDPVIRASHIASKMERDHAIDNIEDGINPYGDWPRYWLDSYDLIMKELHFHEMDKECPTNLRTSQFSTSLTQKQLDG